MSYKKVVKETIVYCEDIIFKEYKIRLQPKIIYKLEGLKNGQAIGYDTINLNEKLFKILELDDIRTIVKHEYSHLVVEAIKHNLIEQKILNKNPKPHGLLWRNTMKLLGVLKPKAVVFYDYAFEAYGFLYLFKCNCRTYCLSKNRISRIKNGNVYVCSKCNGELIQIANELKL